MLNNNKFQKLHNWCCLQFKFHFPRSIFKMMLVIGLSSSAYAQPNSNMYTSPSWWFGLGVGGNLNYFQGSTQQLNSALMAPVPFVEGNGLGLYAAPLIEYRPSNSHWGITLQGGIDSRYGEFKEVLSPCNCPRGLKTNLNYVTIEPSLRFRPFKGGLYIYGGPRISYILDKSFVYSQRNDPANSDQTPIDDITGDFDHVENVLYSMQIGAGYDILLSNEYHRSQFVLSPFVAFIPYLGQEPRNIETWNITTFRAGAALKFGLGSFKNKEEPIELFRLKPEEIKHPKGHFKVTSPKNVVGERRVRETFPLSNYVFFDLGSTEIPYRYILLDKSEVKTFQADQLEVHIPKRLSGRSSRQLIVYYNLLNILGDRLVKNPTATIQLIGSSEQGSYDGLLMAESVRNYLHNVFEIEISRIGVEGNTKPKLPSMQPYVSKEIYLHQEGDRRVSIESNSPGILIEFQSGPDVPLKAIVLNNVQVAPVDSYIIFDNPGSTKAYSSWSVEVEDVKGETRVYGPYNKDKVSIPGKSILGVEPQGNFKITMIGQLKNGGVVREDTSVHVVLWSPPVDEQAMRFSILYGFNNSTATDLYKRYLQQVVVPRIPAGSRVVIHGYTDKIGEDEYNLQLSIERSNDVFEIIKSELTRIGMEKVEFTVFGFGEDVALVPFENDTPEERFYNRTVIVDIIPQEK